MPVTAVSKAAVITMILKSMRELDIQGFMNQDNPTLTNRRYKVESITMSVSPNFSTTVELNSIADAATFSVNEVVKFFNIVDTTLGTELNDLSNEERKIREISGVNLVFYFDSSEFTGTFTSGTICSTYSMGKLNTIAERCIADFETDSGIAFIPTSYHHMRFIRDLVDINFVKLAGAEKSFAKLEYKDNMEKLLKYKAFGFTSLQVDTTDSDAESDFGNEGFIRDLGLGSNRKPLTD